MAGVQYDLAVLWEIFRMCVVLKTISRDAIVSTVWIELAWFGGNTAFPFGGMLAIHGTELEKTVA